MPLSSRLAFLERAKPLLGTTVVVRVARADDATGHAAIDAAFREIAEVHRLMSFHDTDSDLSRLNRLGGKETVRLDPRTAEVLALALDLAERSDGAFDPCVGARAVADGDLPPPPGASAADPMGSWRDVRKVGCEAHFTRPVWLDFGGIAKGYAVDRAIEQLRAFGIVQASVNAGGDLRVIGGQSETVGLRAGAADTLPVVEITDGALASSGGGDAAMVRHYDGASGDQITLAQFVSVAASTCMVADALTKVVLARGAAAGPVLSLYRAKAWAFDAEHGWRSIGTAS